MNENFMAQFFDNADEKPLDRIVTDGGYCRVFRTIGAIGDSLSSGELESMDETHERHYHDFFDYSWGQVLARNTGCKVYNFSRGGMTAKEYWERFAEDNGYWEEDKLCQAYILALGVNDLNGKNQELGSIDDIDVKRPANCRDTFAGYMGRIILRLKSMQPKAKFFLMTIPKGCETKVAEGHRKLLYDLAALFDYTYVLDLQQYGPDYSDPRFRESFFLGSHMNTAGYVLTAQMVTSYIDHIVRHHMLDFSNAGFIGTPFHNVSAPW